ncbi:MAG: hypothetical protein K6G44_05885 [Lentisphaeria bacterium]|nr:hypothetical protein [Lentisphaeria bacterium]
MISPEETTVIDLLRQREAESVKVWECEEGIRNLLGVTDFPYPAVPDLPSRRRVAKGASRRAVRRSGGCVDAATGQDAAPSAPPLRRLEGDETAYRLEFESRGRRESSFQTELDGVRKLFQIRSSEFTMLKVETVVFRTVDDWDLKETLWSKE